MKNKTNDLQNSFSIEPTSIFANENQNKKLPIDSSSLKLTNIFEISELQRLQDSFAKACGVASLITDINGVPITEPSNFCRLCKDIVRKTAKGQQNCKKSDARLGMFENKEYKIHKCFSIGLWDASTKITVDGRHIANWLVGQVKNESVNKQDVVDAAKNIGADENEVIAAYNEIPVMSESRFHDVVKMLNIIANDLSNKTYQSIQKNTLIAELEKTKQTLFVSKTNTEKSEMQLRTLLNSINDIVFRLDKDGRFVEFYNPGIESELYLPPKLFLHKHYLDINLPDQIVKSLDSAFLNIKKNRTPQRIDYPLEINNETKWFNAVISPVFDENNTFDGATIITRDITDRVKMIDDLKKAKDVAEFNERKKTGILNAIPDMMFSFNKQGYIIDYHASNTSELYLSPEIFLNKHHSEVLPPEISDLTKEKIESVLADKKIEYYNYCLDINQERQTFDSRMVYVDEDTTLAIVRNISERVKMIEDLKKAKQKAEESDSLKSAFLANMSHEIRTPMNGIIGFTDLLNENNISENQRKNYIKIISESSQQLLRILNDIIDISKIEVGQVEINETQICLNDMIDDLFLFYKPAATKNNLNIYTNKPLSDKEATILTDATKLRQIIENLLCNALKFTHRGSVSIGYKIDNEMLMFHIRDTGIGILPQYHTSVFERFRQADKHTDARYGGTGLGLSISKAFVEKMGGKIWLNSQPDEGSVFYFTIPYKPVFKKDITTENSKKNKNRTKVLIVEDEEINYMYLAAVLSRKNIDTIHAGTGEEAILHFKNTEGIDLILMDIKLPGIDGLETTRKIKAIDNNIPIIAQTAYAMSGDKEKALAAGCDGYIAKPIKKNDIFELLQKFIKY